MTRGRPRLGLLGAVTAGALVGGLVLSGYWRGRVYSSLGRAEAMRVVGLAAIEYYEANGSYPETLDELVTCGALARTDQEYVESRIGVVRLDDARDVLLTFPSDPLQVESVAGTIVWKGTGNEVQCARIDRVWRSHSSRANRWLSEQWYARIGGRSCRAPAP